MTEQQTSSPAPAETAPEMVTIPRNGLWAAVVTTEHGTDVTVHMSRDGAFDAIAAFADEWWDEEIGAEEERPEDRDDLIEAYFEQTGPRGEGYSVSEVSLNL